MSAVLVPGQPDFPSPGHATTESGMTQASDVAADTAGNIFECESDNRCLQFRPPFSNGMNASVVIGQTDFTSKGTATTQSGLNFPFVGTAVNGGNLFVSDNANDRVLEFTPPFTNGMNASVVVGAPDF